MNRCLRYTLLALLWGVVVAYISYAATTARRVQADRKVTSLQIEVVDSSSQGHLISVARVREWLQRSGIPTVGRPLAKVDLAGIEELILRNGFVNRVVAYVTYEGTLHVSISQRDPAVRLLTDGVNSYATSDGFVFAAPRSSSLYVPVVTGSYSPPFPADYTGNVRLHLEGALQAVDRRIVELERAKYPLYKRELANDRNISALRRMRLKRKWWRMESSREFETRVEELKKHKIKQRRVYRYEATQIQAGLDRIAERQAAESRQQKKLEKSYEDFMKLLTFVGQVEEDDFWRSEVVQIVANTTSSGALEVTLIPRSGRHIILFGRIEQVEQKFDKLMRFYRSGLSSIGWSEYKTIDIRYKDQVVCRR